MQSSRPTSAPHGMESECRATCATAHVEAVALRRANAAWRALQSATGLDRLESALHEWREADRALRAARRVELLTG